MRDTARKRSIVRMLEDHDEGTYFEYGPPPYSATTIAGNIGGSLQSVARTLRSMTEEGALQSVRTKSTVWNAIAQSHIESTVTAYYSVKTMQRDIAAADAWKKGSATRSDKAFEKMMTGAAKT